MPTIQCFITEGASDSGKQRLIATLSQAVMSAVDAPPDAVRVILSEVAPAHFGIAGEAAAARATQAVHVLIQAYLIAGRTAQQKERLIAGLSAATSVVGADPATVRVFIIDLPNTDFGLGGQTAKALGRGIGRDAMR